MTYRFSLGLFLLALAVIFVGQASAQSNMRIQRGASYDEQKYSDSRPITGGVDYRESLMNPVEFQTSPRYGRADLTQLPGMAGSNQFYGAANSMQQRAAIHDTPLPLKSRMPQMDHSAPFAMDARQARLPGDLSEKELSLFKSRDIVIMQDRSSSMGEKEDFPQGTFPRWYWCLSQATDFGRQATRLPDWSFTLVLFSSKYDVYRNVKFRQISPIFQTRSGIFVGTKLAHPMEEQLEEYFQRRANGSKRPLIIAVVTDGKPQDDEDLRDVIINATQHMRDPGEIQIVFLQVGTDDEGQKKLRKLDYKLVRKGARFDIVSVMPFETVTQLGLTRALITAVQNASLNQ